VVSPSLVQPRARPASGLCAARLVYAIMHPRQRSGAGVAAQLVAARLWGARLSPAAYLFWEGTCQLAALLRHGFSVPAVL